MNTRIRNFVIPRKFCRFITTNVEENSRDVFGTLSRSGVKALDVKKVERFYPDEPDNYDKEEYDITPRKNAFYYKYEISKHARLGPKGIRKALELFQQMKTIDRVTPSVENFSPLIYGCAKAGYTRRAFELYEESLKYINKPTQSEVTCLINSCGESPFKEYGLERLRWFLRNIQVNYNYQMNLKQYNCAVKAFGKLGQLDEAIGIVKQMTENGFIPNLNTFHMLLMGCASNKEAGTTLALRIYKRMRYFGLAPDVRTYNLILRCIRDCKMGSPRLIMETLKELPSLTSFEKRLKYKQLMRKSKTRSDLNVDFEWLPAISDLSTYLESAINFKPQDNILIEGKNSKNDKLVLMSSEQLNATPSLFCDSRDLPNLLSDEHLALTTRIESIQLEKLDSPIGRLLLFGGMHGFLKTMVDCDCNPNIKTFIFILCCLPHEAAVQLEAFRLTKDYSVSRDLGFYDLLIQHVGGSSQENRIDLVKEFLEQMHLDNIRPNISTFEAVAQSCSNLNDAIKLITDVKKAGFNVTHTMLNQLVRSSLKQFDFEYANRIIEECLENDIGPTREVVELVELKRLHARVFMDKHKRGILNLHGRPRWFTDEKAEHFEKYQRLLRKWLRKKIVDEEHPWSQFETEQLSNRGPREGSIIEKLRPLIAEREKKFPQFHEKKTSDRWPDDLKISL